MKYFIIVLIVLTNICHVMAQDQQGTLQATHVGDKVLTSEEFIEGLTPKSNYKLRGIKFNQQTQAANTSPPAEPSIAMAINFAFDSATLTNQAVAQLAPLGEALNSEQLSTFKFRIDGHTDAIGAEDYNMSLSKQRAIAVGTYLYQHYGVDIARLVVSGKGESELYDADDPKSGINRRVEVATIVNK